MVFTFQCACGNLTDLNYPCGACGKRNYPLDPDEFTERIAILENIIEYAAWHHHETMPQPDCFTVESIIEGWRFGALQGWHNKTSDKPAVLEVNDDNFQKEVLDAETPVLVHFWAAWCGPCGVVKPVLEEVGKEFGGRLKVVALDTDKNPKTAYAYTIRGIPAVYLFVGDKVVETIIGAVPKRTILHAIGKHLTIDETLLKP